MMRLMVRVLASFGGPASYTFDQEQVTIGRGPGHDVSLHPDDQACSRGVHVRLRRDAGEWWLLAEHDSTARVPSAEVDKPLLKGERLRCDQEVILTLGEGGPKVSIVPETVMTGKGATTKPERDPRRAPPESQIPRDVIFESRAQPRRWKKAIVAAVVVVGVLAIAGGLLARRMSRVEQQFVQLNLFGQSELEKIKASIKPLTESQKQTLEKGLLAARPSVCLVCAQGQDGSLTAEATAWTVANGLLATNAHVAAGIKEAQQHDPETRFVARFTGPSPRSLPIKSSRIHPGYETWMDVIEQTLRRRGATGLEQVSLLAPCDVGLLEVEGDVGPLLEVASPEELKSLKSTDPIGYVGYPRESVPGDPLNAPPSTVMGNVLAVSSPFFQDVPPEEAQLIQHNLVTVGGASGSPVLNQAGRVVGLINAGSVVMTLGGRVPTGINFAQRVDLLEELRLGTAARLQAERNETWQRELRRLTMEPQDLLDAIVEDALGELRRMGSTIARPKAIGNYTTPLVPGANNESTTYKCEVSRDRKYLFVACASDWSRLKLTVLSEQSVIAEDAEASFYSVVAFEANTSGKLTVRVFAERTNLQNPAVYVRLLAIEE